jgi:thiol-disulfide isomerase/thioredoxin
MTAEYGIQPGRVLLQAEHEVFDAFALVQMPAAVMIDLDGKVVRETVYGAQPVRQLVADSLGLALPSPPARAANPVAAGNAATIFRRPDLEGNPLAIGAPAESDTLLLFWNPGCGYCAQLLPELKEWEMRPDRPDIVVISRGPGGLNRELGLASPIVLDDDGAISRAYGATGTPAAIMIDRHGVVASGVGRGASGVRALVAERIATRPPGESQPQVGSPQITADVRDSDNTAR